MQGLLLTLFGVCFCPLFDLNANLIVVPMSRKEAIYLFYALFILGRQSPTFRVSIKKVEKNQSIPLGHLI